MTSVYIFYNIQQINDDRQCFIIFFLWKQKTRILPKYILKDSEYFFWEGEYKTALIYHFFIV